MQLNLRARRRDCKKYDEIRIFVTAVTGAPRNFEKNLRISIATFCANDARSVRVGVMNFFAQMTALERHGLPESIKIERISAR